MKFFLKILAAIFIGGLMGGGIVRANIPGGGTGAGPNVSLTINGDGTVTMTNGVVSAKN